MAPISRWCKDGRRLFLSFLGSFVNDSQPGGPGALEQITKTKNCSRATVLALGSSSPWPAVLRGGGHSRAQEPFWNTNQKAGWVMSQFFFQNACIRRGEQKDHQTQRLHWLELGNAISRRGNWGPHMNPTTMWLSKHAGTRQTKQLAQDLRTFRASGLSGCQGMQGKSSGMDRPRSTISARRSGGSLVERWDGKSGHGAESVRHAEMSLAGNWESIGPVNHRLLA